MPAKENPGLPMPGESVKATDNDDAASSGSSMLSSVTFDEIDYREPDPVADGGVREPEPTDGAILLLNGMPELTPDDNGYVYEDYPDDHPINERPPVKTFTVSPTDSGNADLLANYFQHELRYCPQTDEWLTYDGTRWVKGHGDAAAIMRARAVADGMTVIAPPKPDGKPETEVDKAIARKMASIRAAWSGHKLRSLSLRGLKSMVDLASKNPLIQIDAERLDAYARYLSTPNGQIDLETGARYSESPAWWATKQTGVRYDDNMAAPRWSKFLAETFCGDFELIDYVQELIGASAVGEVFLHIVPFFYGKSGDNGKTVLVEVLRAVMGDYAQQAPANFLMAGRDKHPTEIARLKGARIVFCPELNEGDIFDEAKLKTLASGDTLTGRYMHRDFFDFEPTHSLVMMGNYKPAVKAGGNSFWRRVRVIPFNYKVPEDKQINRTPDIAVATVG